MYQGFSNEKEVSFAGCVFMVRIRHHRAGFSKVETMWLVLGPVAASPARCRSPVERAAQQDPFAQRARVNRPRAKSPDLKQKVAT